MADYATAYNPSDTPVAVTKAGRQIGGHSWGTVNTEDPTTAALLAAGAIVIAAEPPDLDAEDLNPEAVEAHRQTQAAREAGRIGADDEEADDPDASAGNGATTARRRRGASSSSAPSSPPAPAPSDEPQE